MESEIDKSRLPRHVAIIMDGNGRWATARGLDRSEGHVEGVNTVRRITEEASRLGIEFLTLYTFSTENWNRPKAEVDALMNLIVLSIERETPELIKNNVRLQMIGDTSRLPDFARERLERCIADTAHCTGLTLILALSYSSRWEIVKACRDFAEKVAAGEAKPSDMDSDEAFASLLSTASIPDPDLLIRTGGDHRVSNFLLWQIAYSEIYVTDVFWPDFTAEQFDNALLNFQGRERRFGLTSAQINSDQK